ncbi:hypothetical protein SFUMM280S_00022 [Streptomyces fumanus]
MYFTDRGIEELEKRRGEEEITFEWLAEQLRTFVDLNPDFEVPVERLATWLAPAGRRGRRRPVAAARLGGACPGCSARVPARHQHRHQHRHRLATTRTSVLTSDTRDIS